MFDEQIDRAMARFDTIMKDRMVQMDKIFESRIEQLRETFAGVTLDATVNLKMPEVKKAVPQQ